jgi:hypothetical protein
MILLKSPLYGHSHKRLIEQIKAALNQPKKQTAQHAYEVYTSKMGYSGDLSGNFIPVS